MVEDDELIEMIIHVVKSSDRPIPVTLINHAPRVALAIITASTESCLWDGIDLCEVHIDPELARIEGIEDGQQVVPDKAPIYVVNDALSRQVLFLRSDQIESD